MCIRDSGYIYAEYISVSGSNNAEDGEVNAKTTADVNFRSGPGTNYNSKAVIGSGTGIIVTDTGNSQWLSLIHIWCAACRFSECACRSPFVPNRRLLKDYTAFHTACKAVFSLFFSRYKR